MLLCNMPDLRDICIIIAITIVKIMEIETFSNDIIHI